MTLVAQGLIQKYYSNYKF